jgi:hypothetical protein
MKEDVSYSVTGIFCIASSAVFREANFNKFGVLKKRSQRSIFRYGMKDEKKKPMHSLRLWFWDGEYPWKAFNGCAIC